MQQTRSVLASVCYTYLLDGTITCSLYLLAVVVYSAPYEEILKDVRCPVELLKDLKLVWMVRISQ